MVDRKLIGTILVGVTLSTAAVVGLFWWLNDNQDRKRRRSTERIQHRVENEASKSTGRSNGVFGSHDIRYESQDKAPEESKNCSIEKEIVKTNGIDAVDSALINNGDTDPSNDEAIRSGTYVNSGRHNQITVEIEVAKESVAALIGKSGISIRRIQRESNTKMDFKVSDGGDRVCLIRGRPDDVALAQDLIRKHLSAQPTVIQEQLSVPQIYIGRIIGRSGDTIRTIQDYSRAKVHVDSNKENESDENRIVTVKGTQEQVDMALKMINDKIQEEKVFRDKLAAVAANRTQRRVGTPTGPRVVLNSPIAKERQLGLEEPEESESASLSMSKGIFEVYVSCVRHPNKFWIQRRGHESIELDKLGEAMTEYYMQDNPRIGVSGPEREFEVGEIVASPFHKDKKIYRAKLVKFLDDGKVEVEYVDFGDREVVDITDLRVMMPQFLQLKFQAIEATLNLESIDSKWSDEAIELFCNLSYCAQWKQVSARVRSSFNEYESESDKSVLRWWIDLMDEHINIRDKLIAEGFAKSGDDASNKKEGSASD